METEELISRKKILLTGASGTVGFEVLKQLYKLKDRFEITVFDMKSNKAIKKFQPFRKHITVIYGNINNDIDLLKVCYNKDVVIHLAAIIPPMADEKPSLSYQVNVLGTKNLIRLLEIHSPNAFLLYSSSISVYGDRLHNPMITVNDPLLPSLGDEYAKTKILAEESIQSSKLDWSIFRLAAIMGGHKISKLMFHQPLETSMEIATPKDTARAFVNAIGKQEQLSKSIFNLGGGVECRITYQDFLARSFEIYGLGKPDFSPKTFAEKNFHCGNYADGDILNDILNFRKDDLDSYFKGVKKKVSPTLKIITSLFKKPIKKYLQNQSEPLKAYVDQDIKMIDHYFNSNNLK
jgi:nucleoside-diphosphate-sugar epimerase